MCLGISAGVHDADNPRLKQSPGTDPSLSSGWSAATPNVIHISIPTSRFRTRERYTKTVTRMLEILELTVQERLSPQDKSSINIYSLPPTATLSLEQMYQLSMSRQSSETLNLIYQRLSYLVTQLRSPITISLMADDSCSDRSMIQINLDH